MAKKKLPFGVTDILLLVLGVVLFVGILTFFAPCAAREDGGWMTCHWAGQAVLGVAAAITVIAAVHFAVPDAKIKIGLDFAVALLGILAILYPGTLIHLCGMKSMRCHTVMRPSVSVVACVLIVVSAIDFVRLLLARKKR